MIGSPMAVKKVPLRKTMMLGGINVQTDVNRRERCVMLRNWCRCNYLSSRVQLFTLQLQ